ncbi:hypothetical protein GLOIN_2v1603363 [Rhizophagus irregularis DAOM 181602=DAOM 197198]|uniref:Uncharacterized protein n=1 Tax=Rhizophagus irregularis (strain DAOM 181602 / DAOM 197198 / MUCL 43194) TaxID=747089 RepID=A0A2P4Q222_RHIID|nr:hypothetical protein GLOIN_2v1603363 [Rhizophagus irregularis DAOM 181602=DAOM 197198]POG71707.1 hypothetical protein GLOIN_2v1603363 [Rhizophagus irregularis DAOM 181602=DAOM 197198]|eukprot:XP_025178573.1 hypothetical protein GLOIN_2v1603363 [Rhizophagus irregularis DAOM 181602=DAOM 197198]
MKKGKIFVMGLPLKVSFYFFKKLNFRFCWLYTIFAYEYLVPAIFLVNKLPTFFKVKKKVKA